MYLGSNEVYVIKIWECLHLWKINMKNNSNIMSILLWLMIIAYKKVQCCSNTCRVLFIVIHSLFKHEKCFLKKKYTVLFCFSFFFFFFLEGGGDRGDCFLVSLNPYFVTPYWTGKGKKQILIFNNSNIRWT